MVRGYREARPIPTYIDIDIYTDTDQPVLTSYDILPCYDYQLPPTTMELLVRENQASSGVLSSRSRISHIIVRASIGISPVTADSARSTPESIGSFQEVTPY